MAAIGVALMAVAFAAPTPAVTTDRGTYEATASRFIVRDCADLHCFRVLVPWTLGVLPGASLAKWKAYAAIANWMAAVGVYVLALGWGLSLRGAVMAAVISAFGFGSLYTLFDPFTSDPLMYGIGPLLTWLVLQERIALAGERGSGRKQLEDRHKRELRRHRTDELRSGLTVMASSYRDALVRGDIRRPDSLVAAVQRIHGAIEALDRNPNESLLLQALLLDLPSLPG